MFYTGVILETRIYGELSAYIAVSVVLLLEEHVSEWKTGTRALRHDADSRQPTGTKPALIESEMAAR